MGPPSPPGECRASRRRSRPREAATTATMAPRRSSINSISTLFLCQSPWRTALTLPIAIANKLPTRGGIFHQLDGVAIRVAEPRLMGMIHRGLHVSDLHSAGFEQSDELLQASDLEAKV